MNIYIKDNCDVCKIEVNRNDMINIDPYLTGELDDLKKEYEAFDGMVCESCYEEMSKECKLIKQFKEKGLSWLDWNEHNYLQDEHDYTNTDEEIELMESLSNKYGKNYEDGMYAFYLNNQKKVKIYSCHDAKTYDIA